LLGKRISSIGCGGAPSSKAVLDFLRECYGNIVIEGYACTEAGQIAKEDGTIYGGIQFKLLDIPDYGYSNADKPFPRGELIVTLQ
jgi:long-subunit acyl-CoA synthetase (AMP-forming)